MITLLLILGATTICVGTAAIFGIPLWAIAGHLQAIHGELRAQNDHYGVGQGGPASPS